MDFHNLNVRNWLPRIGNVTSMLVILFFIALIAFGASRLFGPLPAGEIQIGVVVIFSIVALLAMLNITVAIFSGFGLTSSQHALGLPEGSVRALIALFLIMIFILMSIYLFRMVSGQAGVSLQGLTIAQVTELQGQIFDIKQKDANTFDVTLRVGISATAEQLALQLVTLLGTLVTAVSAFYFGSSTAVSKKDASPNASPGFAALSIDKITPSSIEAAAGLTDTNLTITGTGFIAGAQGKLRLKGVPEIVATKTTVDDQSKIMCTFNLKGSPVGMWTVVVVNPDGNQVSKDELFEIK